MNKAKLKTYAPQARKDFIAAVTQRANLHSNLKAVQLTLSEADMAQIEGLERGHRLTSPKGIAPQWD